MLGNITLLMIFFCGFDRLPLTLWINCSCWYLYINCLHCCSMTVCAVAVQGTGADVLPRSCGCHHRLWHYTGGDLFCSLAVLNPRVGHTMDVLSSFISDLCHSDWLFHRESCPCLDVVHPGHAWSSSPACTWHCSLRYLFRQLPCFLVVWASLNMLASLLGRCLTGGDHSSAFHHSDVQQLTTALLQILEGPGIWSRSFKVLEDPWERPTSFEHFSVLCNTDLPEATCIYLLSTCLPFGLFVFF